MMFVWASSFVALRLCVYVRVSCVRWYAGGSDKALVSIHNAKPPKNIRVKRDNVVVIRDPMSSATRAELDAKYSPTCCYYMCMCERVRSGVPLAGVNSSCY